MKILVLGDFQGVFPKKLRDRIRKEEFDFIIGVGDYSGISDFRTYFMKLFRLVKNKGIYLSAEEYFGKKKYNLLRKKDYASGKKVLNELNKLGKPCYVIFGNTDWYYYPFDRKINDEKRRFYDKYVKRLKNLRNVNYKLVKIDNFDAVGFGGYMEPVVNFTEDRRDPNWKKRMEIRYIRMKKVEKRLNKLLGRMKNKDIFVFHYPPEGVFDIIKDRKNIHHGKSAGVTVFAKVIKKHKPKLVLCGHMHEYQGAKRLFGSLIVNPGDAEKGKGAIVDISDGKKIRVKFIK